MLEAACWAHARRKLYDIYEATDSPSAQEGLERIAALYQIEEQIRGKPPAACTRSSEQPSFGAQSSAYLQYVLEPVASPSLSLGGCGRVIVYCEGELERAPDGECRAQLVQDVATRGAYAVVECKDWHYSGPRCFRAASRTSECVGTTRSRVTRAPPCLQRGCSALSAGAQGTSTANTPPGRQRVTMRAHRVPMLCEITGRASR